MLPPKLCQLVYSEFHANMGHLGAEKTLQLARERLFWPKMANSISHCVTKVCLCVNQKRPVKYKQVPKQTMTSDSPMELIGVDFLYSGPCTGEVDYLLVTTNLFQVSLKFVQNLIKWKNCC